MSDTPTLPAPLADATDWVRQLDWSALGAEEINDMLVALEYATRVLQAGSSAGCSEFSRKQRRVGRSAGSSATVLGESLGIPAGQARNRSEAGRRRDTRAGRASASGQIAPAQESAIAEAVGRLPRTVTPTQRDEFEDALLERAREGAWTGQIHKTARERLYALAPERAEADEAEQRRRRELRVTPADQQGMSQVGLSADPKLRALLDATLARFGQPGQLMPGAETAVPASSEDPRTPGQRAHDALAHVLQLGLESQETSVRGVATIVVSLTPEQMDALEAAEDGRDGEECAGDHAADGTPTAGGAPAAEPLVTTNCGSVLSVRQAVALAGRRSWFVSCLAENRQELRRIDVDAGPKRRLATALQRLVLYAAHGGCTYPGCERPAARCQAHHLHDYSRGGPTTVANLTLACPTHHGWVGDSPQQWRTVPRRARPGKPKWVRPLSVHAARVCPDSVSALVR